MTLHIQIKGTPKEIAEVYSRLVCYMDSDTFIRAFAARLEVLDLPEDKASKARP